MLSATYSVKDVKRALGEDYDFYKYDSENEYTEAIEKALESAQYKHMIPVMGWGVYGEIRDLDRDLFDDATCDTTDDAETVTMDSTTDLVADMYVYGVGIPSGAQIDSITDSTDFELTTKATEDGTDVILTFNRLDESQYSIYRAEVNYACAEFCESHARKALFTRSGSSQSRSQGGVNISSAGLIGQKQVAQDYRDRGNIMMSGGGYSTISSIKRGDSIHYAL